MGLFDTKYRYFFSSFKHQVMTENVLGAGALAEQACPELVLKPHLGTNSYVANDAKELVAGLFKMHT